MPRDVPLAPIVPLPTLDAPPRRGAHPSGHDSRVVWFLRWAARAGRFTYGDLGWNEPARFALESCVLNGYVAPSDGGALPAGWHVACPFILSPAGRAVLDRAVAAERRP